MENHKIILRAVPNYKWSSHHEIENYTVEYKIDDSELGWFERIFNSWKTIDHCVYDTCLPLKVRGEYEFYNFKQEFKTLEDVYEYESNEYKRAQAMQIELELEQKERDKILY